MNSIEFIRERLSQEELLCQLAEECAELGKAALKLRRVYDGKNPTPVKRAEAYNNFLEEIADVTLCIEVLSTPLSMHEVTRTIREKLKRWATRLEETKCPVCGRKINVSDKECPNCRVSQLDPETFMGEYEEENE